MEYRILRMEDDLKRALKKPKNKRSWIMVIDVDKCIGCHACVVSCIAENVLPPRVNYRKVLETEDGEYPYVKKIFMPTNCMQCDNPPCVKELPEDSYLKRPDGILVFEYEKLKGREIYEKIKRKCPYTAVYYDDGDFYTDKTPVIEPYETRESFEYGKKWKRVKNEKKSPINSVRKCHFCLHRLESGMLPACVTTCIGGAMYFGDRNDSRSFANELLKKRMAIRMYEDEGTEPRIYYLTGVIFTPETCAKCHR
ncbi:MAG: 4Fe-4S dicluster domain-containing protein [Methanosarcinales archaeon]